MKLTLHTVSTMLMTVSSLTIAGCQRVPSIPGVIEGASMAPNWLGEHRRLTCKDCQFPIHFQLEQVAAVKSKLICPNCGYRENPISESTSRPAQQVMIQPVPEIARWDVVASRLPQSNSMCIKRVVGLPGESLEMIDGDLLVDGKIVVKPWPIQKAIRIFVYDSQYEPQLLYEHERWLPAAQTGRWRKSARDPTSSAAGNSFWQCSIPDKDSLKGSANGLEGDSMKDTAKDSSISKSSESDWEWLSYQHWRCCAHRGQRHDRFPLEDIDYFNPSLKRVLNPMLDFCFELGVRVSADVDFAWRCIRGNEVLECRFDVPQQTLTCVLWSRKATNQFAPSATTKTDLPKELIRPNRLNLIEASTFDNQFVMLINGQLMLQQALPHCKDKLTAEWLEVGARRGRISLEHVRLWRDIYYTPLSANGSIQVAPDSYFLVGDNVPLSVDSRHWNPPGVKRKDILGVVKPATKLVKTSKLSRIASEH
jgi:signal peptidase I